MIRQELPACSYRGSTGSPKLIIYGHLPPKTPVRFSADGLATSTSSPLKTPSPVSPGGPALPASLPSSFTACSSLLTCQVTGTCMARISRSCRTSAVNGRSRRRTICLHLPSTGTAPWHSPSVAESASSSPGRCCELLVKKSVFPADSPPASFVNNLPQPVIGSDNLTSNQLNSNEGGRMGAVHYVAAAVR
jgi:hypothetical protein